jgi:hypothetical protein
MHCFAKPCNDDFFLEMLSVAPAFSGSCASDSLVSMGNDTLGSQVQVL